MARKRCKSETQFGLFWFMCHGMSFHVGSRLKRGREIFKYGPPLRGADVLYYSNHVLCYDQSKKIPLWVAEHLTAERMQGIMAFYICYKLKGENIIKFSVILCP